MLSESRYSGTVPVVAGNSMVTKLFSSVPVNFNNREIARFHHDQHKRQPEREGHEQEVIHGGEGKLPSREINEFGRNHMCYSEFLAGAVDWLEGASKAFPTTSAFVVIRSEEPKKRKPKPAIKAILQINAKPT